MSCQNHKLNDGNVPMTQGLVHLKIECSSCDWSDDDYETAIAAAREHHKATGHDLVGDAGYAVNIGSKAHDRLSRQLFQRLGPRIAADMGVPDTDQIPAPI